MAQGEFWVERQNWARWPRVLKVNRYTEGGTETRRYLPERHEEAWDERKYAVGKIAELQAENAKLRELLTIASDMARNYDGDRRLLRRLVQELYEDQCDECDQWKYRDRMRELGIEVNDG